MLNFLFFFSLVVPAPDMPPVVLDGDWNAIEREMTVSSLQDAAWIRATSLYVQPLRRPTVRRIHLRLGETFEFEDVRHSGLHEYFFRIPRDADPVDVAFFLGQKIPTRIRFEASCADELT